MVLSKTLRIAFCVFFEILSLCIVFLLSIFYLFGGFNLIKYEHELIFLLVYLLFLFLLIFIPMLMLKFRILHILFLYIFVFIVFMFLFKNANMYIREKYSDFSYTDWANKPVVRQIMYKDLKSDKNFLSYDKEQVSEKLGVPDERENNNFYYKTFPGYIVVEFQNDNRVKQIYWEHPLN